MRKNILIEDITLSYVEVNSQAEKNILFIHGNSSSANIWDNQISDYRFSNYRLIAIDLPAHGFSSEDPLKRYGIKDLASIVSGAIKKITRDGPLIMVGVSLGTNLITEMLPFIKPRGLVLVSPTIIGDDLLITDIFRKEADLHVMFQDVNSTIEITEYFNQVTHTSDNRTIAELINDYLMVQPPFRSVLITQFQNGQVSNELGLIRNANVEPFIVFGKNDLLTNTSYLDNANIPIWIDHPKLIDCAGHLVHLDQPQIFNEILASYISHCFRVL